MYLRGHWEFRKDADGSQSKDGELPRSMSAITCVQDAQSDSAKIQNLDISPVAQSNKNSDVWLWNQIN